MRAKHVTAALLSVGLIAAAISVGTARASVGVQAPAHAAGPMGASSMSAQPTFLGYYDSHKYTYLSTDVSNKAQAKSMHINYSASLGQAHGSPSIYLVAGTMAAHQLAVFGSEPGAPDYSPLWEEVLVHWKAGAKAVLLTSDNQINALAKKRTVSLTHSGVVLNCPILKEVK